MDGLDEDKRAAMVMHVLEGMSGPQVAATLGLPVDTAYSRIKAGRRVLRARLTALGVEDEPRVYEAARRQTQPTAGARRRVAALLAARIAGSPFVAAVAWKVTALVVATGALGLLGARALQRPAQAAPAVTVSQAPTELEPPEPARAVEPVPRQEVEVVAAVETPAAPSKAVLRGRPTPEPAVDSPADRLREEVALIGGVKAALDDSRPSDAMAKLDEHARRFPEGELALERRGYRAIALCALGNDAQGRGAGKAFVKSHPASTLAGRVRVACGLREKAATP